MLRYEPVQSRCTGFAGRLVIDAALDPSLGPRRLARFDLDDLTFTAHVAARWIEDGTALALAAQQRAEAARRQELALSVLGEFTMRTHPGALHVWLKLPEPWRSEEFTAYAAQHGAGVLSSEATAADSGVCPSAVRVSLCNDEFARLKVGLRILSDILCGIT